MGFTGNGRFEITALHLAPIQVNWLGYPGTMAADWIDYIIADHAVIPPEHVSAYDEAIVYLPHSYQINDHQPIADWQPT